MVIKIVASAALGGVLVFGAALVSKAKRPGGPSGSASVSAGSAEKFAVISHGETVTLADHADPGGDYTVFLFGGDW